jgi:hypothetical protein
LIDTNSTDEGLKLKNASEARALLHSKAELDGTLPKSKLPDNAKSHDK